MKPKELKLSYKKNLGFTEQQHKAFKILEDHNINVNRFIRSAVSEKLKRDWKQIKENHKQSKLPF